MLSIFFNLVKFEVDPNATLSALNTLKGQRVSPNVFLSLFKHTKQLLLVGVCESFELVFGWMEYSG